MSVWDVVQQNVINPQLRKDEQAKQIQEAPFKRLLDSAGHTPEEYANAQQQIFKIRGLKDKMVQQRASLAHKLLMHVTGRGPKPQVAQNPQGQAPSAGSAGSQVLPPPTTSGSPAASGNSMPGAAASSSGQGESNGFAGGENESPGAQALPPPSAAGGGGGAGFSEAPAAATAGATPQTPSPTPAPAKPPQNPSQSPSSSPASGGSDWGAAVASANNSTPYAEQVKINTQKALEKARADEDIRVEFAKAAAKAETKGGKVIGTPKIMVDPKDDKEYYFVTEQDDKGEFKLTRLNAAPPKPDKAPTGELGERINAENILNNPKSTPAEKRAATATLKHLNTTEHGAEVRIYNTEHPQAAGGALTDAELDTLAKRQFDTGEKPSFGLSAKDPNRARYLSAYARVVAANPDTQGAAAAFKAGSADLTQLTKLRGAVGAFEDAFTKDIDLAKEAQAAALPDQTAYRIFNKPINWAETNLSDSYPEMTNFIVATQAVMNQYARIMSNGGRSGTTHVSAMEDASRLLNAAMAKHNYLAAINQMKRESDNVISGLDSQIERQKKDLNGKGGAASKPTPEDLKKKYKIEY